MENQGLFLAPSNARRRHGDRLAPQAPRKGPQFLLDAVSDAAQLTSYLALVSVPVWGERTIRQIRRREADVAASYARIAGHGAIRTCPGLRS